MTLHLYGLDKQAIISPMRRTEKPNGPAGGFVRRPGRSSSIAEPRAAARSSTYMRVAYHWVLANFVLWL
jgi:hypothetical protein